MDGHQPVGDGTAPSETTSASELRLLGVAKFADGKYDDACVDYRNALSAVGTSYSQEPDMATSLRTIIYCDLAACFLELGNYLEAISNANASLLLDANNTQAMYLRARALAKADTTTYLSQALKDVQRALEIPTLAPWEKDNFTLLRDSVSLKMGSLSLTDTDSPPEETRRVPWTGCLHYNKKCRVMSPCCKTLFGCWLCHETEAPSKGCTSTMDRTNVTEVECGTCFKVQPPAKSCKHCNTEYAQYFCDKCLLWNDPPDPDDTWHCQKCGICRKGGRSKFEHCDTCGLCRRKGEEHVCARDCSQTNCPVCLEFLHSSRQQCMVPSCGHAIHVECYNQLIQQANGGTGLGFATCPTCKRSLGGDYDWDSLQAEIDLTPMPDDLREKMVGILCNDCMSKGLVKWHILGQRCLTCGSFNTSRIDTKDLPPGEASSALDDDGSGAGGSSASSLAPPFFSFQ